MTSLNQGTNNKYFSCPAQMADGRIFTDYEPNCELNNTIQGEHQIKNSYVYRQYLINNAESLIDRNRTVNAAQNGCSACQNPLKDSTMSGMSANNNNNTGTAYASVGEVKTDSAEPVPFNI